MRKKVITTTAALAAVAILLAACGGNSGGTSPSGSATNAAGSSLSSPAGGQTLTIARPAGMLTFDPTKANENMSIQTFSLIYDTLYQTSPDGKSLEPSLATGYTLSSDDLTWTFTLRSGVKFSDGSPLTSKDVKFSYERNAGDQSNSFAFMDADISSIDTPNPTTVVFHLKQPSAAFLAQSALYAHSVLPDNLESKSSAEFFANPVGSGPFKLEKWTKGQEVDLVKNDNYWQSPQPKLAAVKFTVVPDANTRTLQLKTGQIDVYPIPTFYQFTQFGKTDGVSTTLFPNTWTEYVLFNQKVKPFQDVNVRRAISYAVNRKAMIDAVLEGHGTVANSYLNHNIWGYDKNTPGADYDLAKAKAALAASSAPSGFDATLLIASGDSKEAQMAQIIKSELAAVNISVTISPADSTTEQTQLANGQYQMALAHSGTDIADPSELTTVEVVGGPNNPATRAFYTNYYNPEVEKLANQALVTSDETARLKIYAQLQKQVAEDAPMAFLFYQPTPIAFRSNVKNLVYTAGGTYRLNQTTIG